jgi:alkylhydroperoxidase/carboxymuconolactone decarboxylase family protein YurZ
MRLGVDEVGVTELMGVTEHARAMATAAGALGLDATGTPLVAPAAAADTDDTVRGLLDEIGAWWRTASGESEVPLVWRILARNPHYIEATWRKDRALMESGRLSARDKHRTALGVAMAGRGRYMIDYHAAVVRRMGDTDQDILEVLGVVDHYTTLNTLSEGMQIESDIRPSSPPRHGS